MMVSVQEIGTIGETKERILELLLGGSKNAWGSCRKPKDTEKCCEGSS
jgi:hypothetical protein